MWFSSSYRTEICMGGVELGLILSVWKGIKNPRLHAGETAVNSVMAFRCVCLSMIDQDHGLYSSGQVSLWLLVKAMFVIHIS